MILAAFDHRVFSAEKVGYFIPHEYDWNVLLINDCDQRVSPSAVSSELSIGYSVGKKAVFALTCQSLNNHQSCSLSSCLMIIFIEIFDNHQSCTLRWDVSWSSSNNHRSYTIIHQDFWWSSHDNHQSYRLSSLIFITW